MTSRQTRMWREVCRQSALDTFVALGPSLVFYKTFSKCLFFLKMVRSHSHRLSYLSLVAHVHRKLLQPRARVREWDQEGDHPSQRLESIEAVSKISSKMPR
jgi:hypothetical protein